MVPSAYGVGSSATGAFLSGIVHNAAFIGLSRGLIEWLPIEHASPISIVSIFVVAIARDAPS